MAQQNRLAKEPSVYLRQHATNPVDWYPWGQEAFDRARQEDKPIFLSVGYATCHWCHVMEGDSFEKPDVAELLNGSFICIKVDRQERPDVDSIYMTAVQAMSHGRGGWPMSVFLTPELKPFWGGTFIPREQFKVLLTEVARLWDVTEEKSRILMSAEGLTQHLIDAAHDTSLASSQSDIVGDTILIDFLRKKQATFDDVSGGFGHAPKFPPSVALMALMRIFYRTQSLPASDIITGTLDAMARGGIYDHVGGGFHRYATDAHWLVPHFEKMLYDNALLAIAYTEAHQLYGVSDYKEVAVATLGYVLRDLRAPEGAFYAGEDADSERTEGKFYVWTQAELRAVLDGSEYAYLVEHFGVKDRGNFTVESGVEDLERAAGLHAVQQANILHLSREAKWQERDSLPWAAIRHKLFQARSKRPRPTRDSMIITGWNGLMIAALAKAGRAFGNSEFIHAATSAADFVKKTLMRNGELLRRFANGHAGLHATLEDFSYLIFGLIELYQATLDGQWFEFAAVLQRKQNELFWDQASGNYFETDGLDPHLIVRNKDVYDSATPSGNGIAALNLARLAILEGDAQYQKQAEAIINGANAGIIKYSPGFASYMVAIDALAGDLREVVIDSALDPLNDPVFCAVNKSFFPNVLFSTNTPRGPKNAQKRHQHAAVPTYHVCHFGACLPPTTSHEVALGELRKKKTILIS